MDTSEENNNTKDTAAEEATDADAQFTEELAQEENDSGIDPDPDTTTDNSGLKFSDKASFREKSTSFLKVLEDSAKYRKLPEPKGKKPGRLQEIETPRTVPEMEDDEDTILSPRRMPPDTLRPLARAKAGQVTKPAEEAPGAGSSQLQQKSRYSRYEELPVTPRPQGRGNTQPVSLPPVAGGRPGMMVGGSGDKASGVHALSYSRQASDVVAKLKMSHNNTPNNTPNLSSPRGGGGGADPSTPRLGKKDTNGGGGGGGGGRISLDTQGLMSSRGGGK